MNKLVFKVLRKHLSLTQILSFFFANLLGLTILFTALTFYLDTKELFEEKQAESSNTNIVINKHVSGLSTLGLLGNQFDERDIQELKKLDNVEEVGKFTSARYSVMAGFDMGFSLYTYIFFESVEDRFIDIKTDSWSFTEGQDYIPIILPRSYLTLYNTAFALSQGLPTVGENSIKNLKISLELKGDFGLSKHFDGQVVGFSDKLNTILVPQSFMTWSNKLFSAEEGTEPSRLILKIKDPSNIDMLDYFKTMNYEVQGSQLYSAQAKFIFQIVSIVVFGLGAVVCLLALYLLVLSTLLLIEKSNKEFEDLLLLGYARRLLNKPFYLISSGAMALAGFVAMGLTYLTQSFYLDFVRRIYPDLTSNHLSYVYLLGLTLAFSLIAVLITFINLSRRMPSLPKKS